MKTIILLITMLLCILFSFSNINAQSARAKIKIVQDQKPAQVVQHSTKQSYISWVKTEMKRAMAARAIRKIGRSPFYKGGSQVAKQQKSKDELIADCTYRCSNQYTGYGTFQNCSNLCNCIYNVEDKSNWDCIKEFVRKEQKAKLY